MSHRVGGPARSGPQAKRQRRKLREIKGELRRRFNRPGTGNRHVLRQVLQGYYQYFAVPNNLKSMNYNVSS